MNSLLQQKNYLIGSPQNIEALKSTEHARVLVVSDVHGKSGILINIVKQFGKSCNALVLCGDSTYDLAELLEQGNENKDFCDFIPPVIAFIQGNGDSSTFPVSFDIGAQNPNANGMLKGTVIVPPCQTLEVNGKNLFIVHGHHQGVDFGIDRLAYSMKEHNCQIALFGHTHVPFNLMTDDENTKNYFINPGSCSRPRGGSPNSCAILTIEKDFCDTAFIKILTPLSNNPQFSIFTPN